MKASNAKSNQKLKSANRRESSTGPPQQQRARANTRESSAVTQQQLENERERDVISNTGAMIKTVKALDAKLAEILDKSNKVHSFGGSDDERGNGGDEGKSQVDDVRREIKDVEEGENQESVDGREEEEYSPPSFATAALSNHGFIDKNLFEKTFTYYKQVFNVNDTVFELNSASSGIDKAVRKNAAFLGDIPPPFSLSHIYTLICQSNTRA